MPGHTPGSCCPLIREERAILFGDACNLFTMVDFDYSTNISTYKENLLKLKTYEDRYDTIYLSHGGPTVDKILLDNNIALCDRILAGSDDKIAFRSLAGGQSYIAEGHSIMTHPDGKIGNIVYSDSKRY